MSENVDLVRSIFADWERGEIGRIDFADPTVEVDIVDGPSPGTFMGLARAAESMREVADAWNDFRVEAEAYREVDDARVIALTRATGRGKASGLQTQAIGAIGFHIHDGKVTRVVIYWDRERALADLGLEV